MKIDKKSTLITVGSIVIGLIAGYAYWRFIGCSSGTCAITSKWLNSTLMGGLFGYLISDSFKPKKKTEVEPKSEA